MFYRRKSDSLVATNGAANGIVPSNVNSAPSIIVSDLNIQGDLVSEGAIEIGGRVNGNVKCNNVTIRKGAFIKGDIESENLIVNGSIEGAISSRTVTVASTGFIKGIIEYGYLTVESGANIDGKCKRIDFPDNIDFDIFNVNNSDADEFIPQIESLSDELEESAKTIQAAELEEVIVEDHLEEIQEKKKSSKKKKKN